MSTCDFHTDPFFLHLFTDPGGELDPAVVVSGTTNGPGQGEKEPGLDQLHNSIQAGLGDRLVSLHIITTKSHMTTRVCVCLSNSRQRRQRLSQSFNEKKASILNSKSQDLSIYTHYMNILNKYPLYCKSQLLRLPSINFMFNVSSN